MMSINYCAAEKSALGCVNFCTLGIHFSLSPAKGAIVESEELLKSFGIVVSAPGASLELSSRGVEGSTTW